MPERSLEEIEQCSDAGEEQIQDDLCKGVSCSGMPPTIAMRYRDELRKYSNYRAAVQELRMAKLPDLEDHLQEHYHEHRPGLELLRQKVHYVRPCYTSRLARQHHHCCSQHRICSGRRWLCCHSSSLCA